MKYISLCKTVNNTVPRSSEKINAKKIEDKDHEVMYLHNKSHNFYRLMTNCKQNLY